MGHSDVIWFVLLTSSSSRAAFRRSWLQCGSVPRLLVLLSAAATFDMPQQLLLLCYLKQVCLACKVQFAVTRQFRCLQGAKEDEPIASRGHETNTKT